MQIQTKLLLLLAAVIGHGQGAAAQGGSAPSEAAVGSDRPTRVYLCQTQGFGAKLVIFNKLPITAAKGAVMGGYDPDTQDFHPLYGMTRFVWQNGRLSLTFESTLPIDWAAEEAAGTVVDGCYTASAGGYYMFEALQLNDQGQLVGTFHDPNKYVVMPGKTCALPPDTAPVVGVTCTAAPDARF